MPTKSIQVSVEADDERLPWRPAPVTVPFPLPRCGQPSPRHGLLPTGPMTEQRPTWPPCPGIAGVQVRATASAQRLGSWVDEAHLGAELERVHGWVGGHVPHAEKEKRPRQRQKDSSLCRDRQEQGPTQLWGEKKKNWFSNVSFPVAAPQIFPPWLLTHTVPWNLSHQASVTWNQVTGNENQNDDNENCQKARYPAGPNPPEESADTALRAIRSTR